MRTVKALTGLLLAPAFVLLAEAGVTLLPCVRHNALRRQVYAGLRADWRTVCASGLLWNTVVSITSCWLALVVAAGLLSLGLPTLLAAVVGAVVYVAGLLANAK